MKTVETPNLVDTDDLPWWQSEYILTDRVGLAPTEVVTAETFDKKIDILNYSDQALSAEEQEQVSETLSAIASFTGGKAFDRIKGVAFAPRSVFNRTDKNGEPLEGSAEIAGFYNAYSPVVMMNIDAMRAPLSADITEGYHKFVEKHFSGRPKPTQLQYFLAHEIGHAMDLTYMSEIKKHMPEPDKVNPHWSGFKTTDKEDIVTKDFDAFEHPDPSVYLLEPSLTSRARLDASEDFAETFAIAALGGDISSVPNKMKRLIATITHAKGQEVIGPHKVRLKAANNGRAVLRLIK